MKYLLCAIAFFGLLRGLPYLITFLQLRKLRLQPFRCRLQSRDRAPAHLKKLLQQPIRELVRLGFKPYGYLQVKPMVKLYPPLDWEILLCNKALKTYAKVGLRRPCEPVDLFDIEFYTFFKDRSCLVTLNGKAHGIVGGIPNATVEDPYAAQALAHWQAHQERLKELAQAKAPCGISPATFAQALQASEQNYLDSLVRSGALVSSESNSVRLTARTALKQTRTLVRGASKAAKRLKQRQQQAQTDPELRVDLPVELEVEGFQRTEQLQQNLVGRKARTGLFFASIGAFIAAYASLFAPYYLAIFLSVLLLHEGGHLLAMKLCGYRNTSMLFIPFLGAVATARQKDDATLSQKFWVLFAGPLPGLILGVGLAIATRNGIYPHWVQETIWMLVGLNFFNLLPIYPLDGGQIADLLLFSRFPYLGVCFKILGVGCLALISLAQPLFLLFALLIAFTIPSSFRTAKIKTQLRQDLRQNPIRDRQHLLHSIFSHLKQLGYGNLAASNRYTLAKGLVQSHRELRAKGTTRVALALLYVGSILGGMVGSLQAIAPNFFATPKQLRVQLAEDQEREIERATAELRLDPNDADVYLQRGQTKAMLDDREGALADFDAAIRLRPNDADAHFSRASLRLELNDPEGALADYTEAIALNPRDELGYVRRGYIRQKLGDYHNALVDINTALELNPDNPHIYRLRSQVLHLAGDEQGAIADEQKAKLLYQSLE